MKSPDAAPRTGPDGSRNGFSADQRATSPIELSRKAWWQVVRRTWREAGRDNVSLVAAGVSFYVFLAVVPLLASVVLLYGLIADPGSVIEQVRGLSGAMPAQAAGFLAEQMLFVVSTTAEKKGLGLLTALALSIFGARAAAGAVIGALNIAYEQEEQRGWFSLNLGALLITAGGVLFGVLGLLGSASIGLLEKFTALDRTVLAVIVKVATSLLTALSVMAISAVLYRFGPCRGRAQWRWVLPGALLFGLVWTLLTLLFGLYVSRFGSFGATYGSLATIMIFLTWIYAAAYALLLGAELNAELEHQTERDSTVGPEQPRGERQAWVADHVAERGS